MILAGTVASAVQPWPDPYARGKHSLGTPTFDQIAPFVSNGANVAI